MIHLLDQISENMNNKVEIIELECHLLQRFDNKALAAQLMPLEKVLNKVGFRNKLREVRVMLPVTTSIESDRYKTRIGFIDLFSFLRERGVVISVQDII